MISNFLLNYRRKLFSIFKTATFVKNRGIPHQRLHPALARLMRPRLQDKRHADARRHQSKLCDVIIIGGDAAVAHLEARHRTGEPLRRLVNDQVVRVVTATAVNNQPDHFGHHGLLHGASPAQNSPSGTSRNSSGTFLIFFRQ